MLVCADYQAEVQRMLQLLEVQRQCFAQLEVRSLQHLIFDPDAHLTDHQFSSL
jgi:hypothetical protein